jgi:hypothetical protein
MGRKAATSGFFLSTLLSLSVVTHAAGEQALSIVLGDSVASLNGPWRFHTGDDSRWADPATDDSGWDSVDLTPLPGANDGDVGLPNYVPGWTTRGHAAYQGYAWYRIHLAATPPTGKTLALLGPWAIDSAYQVFGNGTLLGGVGDFSDSTPIAHGYHYPRFFALPPETASAIRCVRLAFLLVFALIVYQGLRDRGREAWYALPAMLAIAVVLFASELAAVHVPGIWFPWGVGVSLGECASVLFDALLFLLLIRRLWSYLPQAAVLDPVR